MRHCTYIFHFITSDGIKIYAGKHTLKPNEGFDEYNGSGEVITRAIKKYGVGCIVYRQWFFHESEDAAYTAEKELIALIKSECGRQCVNTHPGGRGGDMLKYAAEEVRIDAYRRGGITRTGVKRGKYRPGTGANIAASRRTGLIWQRETYLKLWDYWNNNKIDGEYLKRGKLQTLAVKNNIVDTNINMAKLVNHFNNVVIGTDELIH